VRRQVQAGVRRRLQAKPTYLASTEYRSVIQRLDLHPHLGGRADDVWVSLARPVRARMHGYVDRQ
jgi:hypothetical protein